MPKPPYQDFIHRNAVIDALQTPASPAAVAGSDQRDQWSGPGAVTNSGDFGRLRGFDQGNFANPGMQTAKYQAGRIFSRYDPTGVGQIFTDDEFKKLFPNAKPVGSDKIDFGDGRPVDVIQGYDDATGRGVGWQWLTQDEAAPASAATGAPAPVVAQAGTASNLPQVLQEITALAQGTASPSKRRAILDLLGPSAPSEMPSL